MRNHPCAYMTGRDMWGTNRCYLPYEDLFPTSYCPFVHDNVDKCKDFCQTPPHLNKRFWRKFKNYKMGLLKGWMICTFAESRQGYQERKSMLNGAETSELRKDRNMPDESI